MRTVTAAFAVLLLAGSALVPAAHAQNAAPAAGTGATGAGTTAPISDADRKFLVKDAQGSLYEQALGRLAQRRATGRDVKAYAERIVTDHDTANQALQDLAMAKGVTLPTAMTAADQRRLAGMDARTARSFDAAFVKEAIRINADDKSAAAAETAQTQDADIKDFLSKFSAMDSDHERMALALRK